jgi:aryl-alcohol dehydrogenase-like predicted oxidoreductase
LIQLKKKGYIKKIGISLYSPKEINNNTRKFKIDVVQIPLNVFDQRFLKNNFLSKLKRKNIEIHVRSIFLQGLLTLTFDNLPKKFRSFKNTFKNWENFIKVNNSSAIKQCLTFVTNIDEIDKIVIGVDSSEDLNALFSRISAGNYSDFSKLESNNLRLIDPRKW